MTKTKMPVAAGTRVRFTRDNLGASVRTDLGHVIDETFGIGDEGRAAFLHPNKMAAGTGWFYVEVSSKKTPAGRSLFVAVRSGMWETA